MNKCRIAILAVFVISLMAIQAGAVPDPNSYETTLYSSYQVNKGVYLSGITNINAVDGSVATFNETKSTVGVTGTSYAFDTETLSHWTALEGLSSLDASTDYALFGTYSIKGTPNTVNLVTFKYDGYLGWNLADIVSMNLSVRVGVAHTLDHVRLHYDADTYFEAQLDLGLTINTWNNITIESGLFDSYGGMSEGELTQWVEITFDSQAPNQAIYLDGINIIGETAGTTSRRLSTAFTFNGITQKGNYIANITGRYNFSTSFSDSFFTESADNWAVSSGASVSVDSANAVYGTNAVKVEWDSVSDLAITFTPATSMDLRDYFIFSQYLWSNVTSIIDTVHLHKDASNYYVLNLDAIRTTTPTVRTFAISLFSQVGTVTKENITSIELHFLASENTVPLTIWIDRMHVTDTDAIRFTSPQATGKSATIFHTLGEFTTVSLELDFETIRNTGIAVIYLNDTFHANDAYNTTLEIDSIQIIGWDDTSGSGGETPTTPEVPTTGQPPFVLPFDIPTWAVVLGFGAVLAVVVLKFGAYRLDETIGGTFGWITDKVYDLIEKLKEVFSW